MAFLIGRKIKMDQIWNEDGTVIPVTVVQAGPVTVTQVRTQEKDGYEAYQVGFEIAKKKNIPKALRGHFKDLGPFKHLKEFKKRGDQELKRGDVIDVSAFKKGERVRVTGTEKGRGFQGVVKRHGFHGGPKSHGQKDRLRAPGSIGAGGHQRVIKGRKMAGRMGQDTVTLKKLPIVDIDTEKNILYIKGSLPGNNTSILYIEKM